MPATRSRSRTGHRRWALGARLWAGGLRGGRRATDLGTIVHRAFESHFTVGAPSSSTVMTLAIGSGARAGSFSTRPAAVVVASSGTPPASRRAAFARVIRPGTVRVPSAGQSNTWRYTVRPFVVLRPQVRRENRLARVP